MRTNTRVEFGLYDVTARGDSAPSCTTAKPFCNLGRDLLLESVPSQNKYGTLESEQCSWMAALPSSRRFPSSTSGGCGAPRRATRAACLPTRLCWTSPSRKTTAAAASRCTFTSQQRTGPAASKSSGSAKTEDLSLRSSFTPNAVGLLLRQEGRELPPHPYSFFRDKPAREVPQIGGH